MRSAPQLALVRRALGATQSQPNVASRTTKQRACLAGASLAASTAQPLHGNRCQHATTTQHVADADNDTDTDTDTDSDNIRRTGRAGWPQRLKP